MMQYYKSLQERKAETGDEGFTLIELLIVIVVLGILAAVVVFALGSVTGNAQAAACQADAKTVETGVSAYNAGVNQPPPIALEVGGTVANDVNATTYATFAASGGTATQAKLLLGPSANSTLNSWPGQSTYAISLAYTTAGAIPGIGTAGQVIVWVNPATYAPAVPTVYDTEGALGCLKA